MLKLNHMQKNNEIHIALAHNDNYTEYAVVAVTSVCETTRDENLVFHILDGGLSENSKRSLIQVAQSYKNAKIEFNKIDDSILKKYKLSGYPERTFWSVLVPQVKEISKLERVIYLESDIVAKESLKPLWDMDFEDNFVLAVEDAKSKKYSRKYLDKKSKFFNTGLMVINCKKWNEENIPERAVYMALKNSKKHTRYDKIALNKLFVQKVKFLDLRWNLQYCPIAIWAEYENLEEYKNAINNPAIIHFTSVYKPWRKGFGCYQPKQEDYLRAHKLTEFRLESYATWQREDRAMRHLGFLDMILKHPLFFLDKKYKQMQEINLG